MKYSLVILLALSISPKVFGYVALPTNGDHSNADSYLSDCVDNNGEGNSSICETAARQAFPQDFEVIQPDEAQEVAPSEAPVEVEPQDVSEVSDDASYGS